LDGPGPDKGFLEGMEAVRGSQTFDGCYFALSHFPNGDLTGEGELRAYQDRAGSALAPVAAALRSREAEVIAQYFQEALLGIHGHFLEIPIYFQPNPVFHSIP